MGSKTILIVDDDPVSVKILFRVLSSAGYQAIQAHGGYEAFYKIKLLRPALVITDVLMPSLSGYQLVVKIRQLECALRMTPVIVMSAKSSMRDLFTSLQAEAFLTKPLDPDQLLEVVREIAGEPQSENHSKEEIEQREPFEGSGKDGPAAHYHASNRDIPLSAALHAPVKKMSTPNMIEIYGKNLETIEKLKTGLEDGYYEVKVEHSLKDLLTTSVELIPATVLIEYIPGSRDSIDAYRKLKSHPDTMSISFFVYCEEGTPYWQQSIIPDSEVLTFPKSHPEELIVKIKQTLAA